MPSIEFQVREGTQDKTVFEEVFTKNQYALPDSLPEHSLIIDIGANVGAFALACLARGAGTVVCFEPCPDNFAQLKKNTLQFLNVAAFHAAVWRSDRAEKLSFVSPGKHTACGGCVPSITRPLGAVEVTSMGLDELLWHCTDGGQRRVSLLKIDAEGSEYSILYTCKHLDKVDEIIGETHQYPAAWPGDRFLVGDYGENEACASGMKKYLESQGFTVWQRPEASDNDICTLFWATRKSRKVCTKCDIGTSCADHDQST